MLASDLFVASSHSRRGNFSQAPSSQRLPLSSLSSKSPAQIAQMDRSAGAGPLAGRQIGVGRAKVRGARPASGGSVVWTRNGTAERAENARAIECWMISERKL